ncbi:hypothetical protein RA264_27885, partial [Pseudomonas syringae pv. tagetis]|uniref:hypothetical protein n=1 Tax=Pseudomonas syringae group genomosp. 7 TaxID=251699 RepID=UPI00376F4C32
MGAGLTAAGEGGPGGVGVFVGCVVGGFCCVCVGVVVVGGGVVGSVGVLFVAFLFVWGVGVVVVGLLSVLGVGLVVCGCGGGWVIGVGGWPHAWV